MFAVVVVQAFGMTLTPGTGGRTCPDSILCLWGLGSKNQVPILACNCDSRLLQSLCQRDLIGKDRKFPGSKRVSGDTVMIRIC